MKRLIVCAILFAPMGADADALTDCLLESNRSILGTWDSVGTRLLANGEIMPLNNRETSSETSPGTFHHEVEGGSEWEAVVKNDGYFFNGIRREDVICERHADEFREHSSWTITTPNNGSWELRVYATNRPEIRLVTSLQRPLGSNEAWRVSQAQTFGRVE